MGRFLHAPSRARVVVHLLLVAAFVFLARHAIFAGDGWEYHSMLESWFRHGSPEQRAGDVERARAILAVHDVVIADARAGFFQTPGGHWFSCHFWLYPLACLPAKLLLHFVGADEFYALAWTNAALFAATVMFGLRRGRSFRVRAALVLLASVGPIAWYVAWPHAEVFCWAFVVSSLLAFSARHYGRAALFAAIASTQAPPVALLSLAYVAAAVIARRWRAAVRATAATSLAALPALFYLAYFGRPNLIVATGMAATEYVSVRRMLAIVADLDHGMLPFVPFTLAFAVWGLIRATRMRRWEAASLVAIAALMLAAATQTCNFNAGCAGMNRYATWLLPVLAFVGARQVPWRLAARATLGIGMAAQLAILAGLHGYDDAHEHGSLSRMVLRHAPWIYNPEVETFAERTTHHPADVPFKPLSLPIAFHAPSGVTKLLIDNTTLADLDRYFDVEENWWSRARTDSVGRRGVFYLEPPPGAVVRHSLPPVHKGEILTFGEGWYGAEGAPGPTFRWMGARASLRARRSVAGGTLRMIGLVPSQLDPPPMVRIAARDVEVDRFVAPQGTFTRDVALPGVEEEVLLTIETSEVFNAPDGRKLGYALTRFGPPISTPATGGPTLRFEGGWEAPYGVPPNDVRCMKSDATLRIDARGERRVLLLETASPEDATIGSTWSVIADGHEIEHGPLFVTVRREWALLPDASHTVEFHVSSGFGRSMLCFVALRAVALADLD